MANWFSKKNRRTWLVRVAPPVAYILTKLLFATCKKVLHEEINGADTPSIYAAWHGDILALIFGYMYYAKQVKVDAIISRHSDGEMIARVVELAGAQTIRGSSSKGGSTVLRAALRSLKNGRDVAITPDGPRGPRYSVADGVVVLAQMRRAPIIAVNCRPSSFWTMNSWDAFCIPKPFSTLHFYYSNPFYVDGLSLEEAKALIQRELLVHAANA